ncbi:hypothetical protein EG329_006720 [Mollisiaceae sp. DMI_Dod_QoI]|nr:hypothetical protein EG329_006720 [Helotiales sp. DMI_Dod_QoI]
MQPEVDHLASESEFHLFPNLPVELRRHIWRLALPTRPRIITCRKGKKWDKIKTHSLPIAAVNVESRTVFLSVYTQLFLTGREYFRANERVRWYPSQLYADLSQDALFLHNRFCLGGSITNGPLWLEIFTPSAIENVKHVIYEFEKMGTFMNEMCAWVNWRELQRQLLVFKNLETLVLQLPYWQGYLREKIENGEKMDGRPMVKVEIVDVASPLAWLGPKDVQGTDEVRDPASKYLKV